ncbi:MAG: RnfABCDGE type electron transport complex subunit D [bacterium]|nr:RnfABCDGE type electron transport complex subunit D [bacterium]
MKLQAAPFLHGPETLRGMMNRVLWALLPLVAWSFYKYGLAALAVIGTSAVGCWAMEAWLRPVGAPVRGLLGAMPPRAPDASPWIAGILLGLSLPPGTPCWIALVGAVVAMTLGKWAFGGLGHNLFNPAVVARVFLQAAFPATLTTWHPAWQPGRFTQLIPANLAWPMMAPSSDGISGATPLGLWKFSHQPPDWWALVSDQSQSSLGDGAPGLVLVLGLALVLLKVADWRIPVGILVSAALVAGLFRLMGLGPGPLFHLSSGGLMLGAWFMATDPVTSPVSPKAIWVYSWFIGTGIVLLRQWGGQPEVTAYLLLMGNAMVPLVERWLPPTPYGANP